jgi:hypothetical protein
MSILNTLNRYVADYRARRLRARTYAHVTSLPHEIQKDIGWPEAYGDGTGPRRNAWR